MKTIEITVSKHGSSTVETNGFTGDQCRQASQFLTQALGPAGHEQLKPEFYVQARNEGTIEQKE